MNFDASNIYLNYFRLEASAYRDKVKFYEENPSAISLLYFDERIEIDIDYLLCLFEVGRYERFLSKIDQVLESIIVENIFEFKNQNIFNELLFRKAACLFQLKKYQKAEDILKQLIRMENTNPLYIGLYSICKRKQPNDASLTIKAMANASFLLVLGITVARIFLIEPFFDQWLEPFLMLRNVLFIFGLTCVIGLEIGFQYKIYKETGIFSNTVMNKIFGGKVK
jgi:tetratricopeptide (TPR) repeat protein